MTTNKNPFDRATHPEHRDLWNVIANGTRTEQTEAWAFAQGQLRGLHTADVDGIIGAMLDAGVVRSTVIDGGEYGYLPGLVRVPDPEAL